MDTKTVSRANALSYFSLILGVLALLLCWIFPVGIFFASMAIGLGLLSRGRNRMHVTAVAGTTTGVIAGFLAVFILGALAVWAYRWLQMNDFSAYFREFLKYVDDPELKKLLQKLLQDLLGGVS